MRRSIQAAAVLAAAAFLSVPAIASASPEGPAPEPAAKSCDTVAWVTDSTGINLHKEGKGTVDLTTTKEDTPMVNALRDIAKAKTLEFDVLGARSLNERVNNQPNGIEALQEIMDRTKGKVDCVLLHMGTNDAANVVVGSGMSAEERIKAVRAVAPKAHFYWVAPELSGTSTVNGYTTEGVDVFNKALKKAALTNDAPKGDPEAATEHTLTVLDQKALFAENANKDGNPANFFEPDGIHFPASVAKFRADSAAKMIAATNGDATVTVPLYSADDAKDKPAK